MEKKEILRGAVLVGLGASFYGLIATFVKIAYQDGYTTGEVLTAQYSMGVLGFFLLTILSPFFKGKKNVKAAPRDKWKLYFAGFTFGCTSLFYYLSVQYIDVSIAIVLLMQSVWFSVVLEAITSRKFPEKKKIIATIVVLIGTLLATNTIQGEVELDGRGLFWGILAATSYTITMYASNKIANYLPPAKKSLFMLLGGATIVVLFLFFSQIGPLHFDFLKGLYAKISTDYSSIRPYNFSILYPYGIFLAVFGAILPPFLFNWGFPKAGLGLGSIVSSIELPVSVTVALLFLHEQVIWIQWLGIILILFAIFLMNYSFKKKEI